MGTGTFPVVQRPGRGFDHPLPSGTEVEEKLDQYLLSPSEEFYLYVTFI